jgi:predicted O-linked N-acetylglucosamine transferase (SPINDLY family)
MLQPLDVPTGYRYAVEALKRGDPARARLLCQSILRVDPAHADTLRLAGLIACQFGGYEEGIAFFEQSLAVNPRQPAAHAHIGGALVMLRRPAEAISHCDTALRLAPDFGEAHYSRGCAFQALERHAEAAADFDQTLRVSPRHVSALINRGNALHKLGLLAEALASFECALSLEPDNAGAAYNQGNVLRDMGRFDAALTSYDRALARNFKSAELLNNRGNALRKLGRIADALTAYEEALRLQPEALEPLNNRGLMLLDLGRPKEALECFDAILGRKPGFTVALDNRASALRMQDRHEETLQAYAELARLAPDFKGVALNLHFARAACCDWSHFAQDVAAVIDSVGKDRPANPFPLLAVSADAALQRRCARAFASAEGWREGGVSSDTHATDTQANGANERIKVAYVSADFRQHAVSVLLAGVLEQHDRGRFEIIGIALQPEDHSAFGQRVRHAFDQYVDVTHVSDREVAALMRERQIDIAVDLMGYTRWCRPGIFASRPARAQVNYLGYPGGMGVPFMDYVIADEFLIPPRTAHLYDEQIVYLPDCFQPNDDQRVRAPAPLRSEAGLPKEGLVFCCFNNSYKITPPLFDIWMRLLDRTPGSVLWMAVGNPAARENLRREAAGRGVDPERLVLTEWRPYAEHLGRLQLADLFLDTLPFNGGTTASDALWAGVPVVTCAGEAFASRMAGSLLRAAGIPELVTDTLQNYEQLALDLSRDPDRLRGLRERLQSGRETAPLFDTARYCRNLESAYVAMHTRAGRGERRSPIVVGS